MPGTRGLSFRGTTLIALSKSHSCTKYIHTLCLLITGSENPAPITRANHFHEGSSRVRPICQWRRLPPNPALCGPVQTVVPIIAVFCTLLNKLLVSIVVSTSSVKKFCVMIGLNFQSVQQKTSHSWRFARGERSSFRGTTLIALRLRATFAQHTVMYCADLLTGSQTRPNLLA